MRKLLHRLDTLWRSARLSRTALGKYIILYASALHLIWAALLMFNENTAQSTPIHIIVQVFGGRWRAAVVLVFAACIAIVFPFLKKQASNTMMALLLVPQQTLLILSAGAGLAAVVNGHYADGVVRAWPFIMADQLPVILAALLYSAAIVEASFESPNARVE